MLAIISTNIICITCIAFLIFDPQMVSNTFISIYTDGASRGNPGPGGYGVLLMFGKHRKELSKGYIKTTNNRMELRAVIAGLEAITKPNQNIIVYSDSKYVVDSVSKGWLTNWIKTDFKGGKKNKDLWLQYAAIAKNHQVKFQWVKGHASNPYNNRCDELATAAADNDAKNIDEGFLNTTL